MSSYERGTELKGKYRVERVLAQGGMGVVLLATHVQLKTRVALKLMQPGLASDGELAGRFLREARIAARLTSDHVVRVIDVDRLDSGEPFMVMEHLKGVDLGQELEAKGPLPVSAVADFGLQVCAALAEAHAHGVVHRDIKPSNLFLAQEPDGRRVVKLLDFGISKARRSERERAAVELTQSEALLGSPAFMPPEQFVSAKDVDARADLWALGATLFRLLTNQLPFEGSSPSAVAARVASAPPRPLGPLRPDVPLALQQAISRCLARDPGERFASVVELADALEPFRPEGAVGTAAKVRAAWQAAQRQGRNYSNDDDEPSVTDPAFQTREAPVDETSAGTTVPPLTTAPLQGTASMLSPVKPAPAEATLLKAARHSKAPPARPPRRALLLAVPLGAAAIAAAAVLTWGRAEPPAELLSASAVDAGSVLAQSDPAAPVTSAADADGGVTRRKAERTRKRPAGDPGELELK